jgi:hypothetical protein
MTDLFWPGDDRAEDLLSDASLVAEQRSLAALTSAEAHADAQPDYCGAADPLVDDVLDRAHLEETP